MTRTAESGTGAGIRSRLGELSYALGVLWPLQRLYRPLLHDLRILAYHRVLDVPDPSRFDFDLELVSASPDCFREQMRLLRRHFHPVALGEVAAAFREGRALPPNAVAVTFDDGYDDNYRLAYPILREVGVPATFFVSTGHVDSGRPFAYDWLVHMVLTTSASDVDLPEFGARELLPASREGRHVFAMRLLDHVKTLDDSAQSALIARLERTWAMPRGEVRHPDCQPVSWTQLREMRAAGFEIGSHGVDHRMLSKLPQTDLENELNESKAVLERALGGPADLMAYPVGGDRAFDGRVIAATNAAGYALACTYICGVNRDPAGNRYTLRRLPVERAMGLGWFAAMLAFPGLMTYPTATGPERTGQA
ncbi:polysaccharide deacetylase family protein [Metallibacterium sp.]|uniref:polysaccharide deacetylase family protein n=1 Tax=Metallibacterium sp. TaxID=2940281 RepID=UPI002625DCA9|nr:polysaccharide deacetylase family protein [Metallibacterium sp.]